MADAITTLINELEETVAYYELHEKMADYQDLRDTLDRYYKNSKFRK